MKPIDQYRPSPIYALVKILPLAVLSLLLVYLSLYAGPLIIVPGMIIPIVAAYKYFYIYCTRYLLTRDELQVTSGIFTKRTESTELFRIKDYVITQPFWMRIFHLMSVKLFTSDRTTKEILLSGIPASDFTQVLQDLVREARLRNNAVEIS
ncbi:PH domain-containing protein [Pedobacter sp. ISL-68]|uniref:PH domain-containing protein n=1 Tax=unclassified Pedobacter TaxID=2628915 RepID=UPI001BE6BAA8|nr:MULTISPECIES: PH domain-containing protein [unclassified Pedobacter]MBT2560141.1 PH domain-containing protein [Pedobacter sp. ISL-64]MBT2589120.1 PH domain-containing protein [Pedobacter sp. ISL-68]